MPSPFEEQLAGVATSSTSTPIASPFQEQMAQGEPTPAEYAQRSQAAGLAAGRAPQEQEAILKARGFAPEAVKPMLGQYRVKQGEQNLGRFAAGRETIAGSIWGQLAPETLGGTEGRAVPFRSWFVDNQKDVQDANKRLGEGTATDKDVRTLALAQRAQQDEEGLKQAGIAGDVIGALRSAPAIMGEYMAGGRIAKGVLGDPVKAGFLRTLGTEAGRMAIINSAMPSQYMDVMRQKNVENGRAPDSWEGLAPAWMHSYAQLLVLNRVFKAGAGAEPGVVAGTLGAARTGVTGALEMGAADTATRLVDQLLPKAYEISTGHGTFEKLLKGDVEGGLRKFATDAMTLAAFTGLHRIADGVTPAEAAKKAEDVVKGAADELKAAKEAGLPPEAVTNINVEHSRLFMAAKEMDPGITRAEMEKRLETAGPIGPLMEAMVAGLPRSRAAAEPAAPPEPAKPTDGYAEFSDQQLRDYAPLLGMKVGAKTTRAAIVKKLEEHDASRSDPSKPSQISALRAVFGTEAPASRPLGEPPPPTETPPGGKIVPPERSGEAFHKTIGDIYDRAATATPAEIEQAKTMIEALSGSGRAKAAEAMGMVGKPTKQELISRITERRGAAIRRTLVGKPGKAAEEPVEHYYRTPDSKGAEDNVDAAVRELVGDQFAGKWFSRTFEGNQGYKGHVQLEFRNDRLGAEGDVVSRGEKDVQIGGAAPMYMHPGLRAVRYRGAEDTPQFKKLKEIVDTANQERAAKGIEPIELLTGEAAKEARNASAAGVSGSGGRAGVSAEPQPVLGRQGAAEAKDEVRGELDAAAKAGEALGGVSERPTAARPGAAPTKAELREGAQAAWDATAESDKSAILADPQVKKFFEEHGVEFGKPLTAEEKAAGASSGGSGAEKPTLESLDALRTDLFKGNRAQTQTYAEMQAEIDRTLAELRSSYSEAELKSLAKQLTGRGGRNADAALAYIREDLLAVPKRIAEGQWEEGVSFTKDGRLFAPENTAPEAVAKAIAARRAKGLPVQENAEFGKPMTAAEQRTGRFGGGSGLGEEGGRPPMKETALANAVTADERVVNRLAEIEAAARQANPDTWARMLNTIAADPNAETNLINELVAKPRSTSVEENALLLHRRIALSNEYERAIRQANDAFMKKAPREEKDALTARADSLLGEIDRLDGVIHKTGTETGRALQFRRQLAREDFSLSTMLGRTQIAKGDVPLTPEEKAEVVKLHDEIKAADAEVAAKEAERTPGAPPPGEPGKLGEKGGDLADAIIKARKKRAEFAEKLDDFRYAALPVHKKVIRTVGDTFNAVRSIITAFDLSAVFRQGGFIAASRPMTAIRAIPEMLRSFASEHAFERAQQAIRDRPNAIEYAKSGLYLADTAGPLTAREEAFVGRWTKKIPGVAASERAYNAFLNRVRADVFDSMTASLARTEKPSDVESRAIANFINVSTGRGPLGATLDRAAVPLATLFFSPRFVVSRFQLLTGQPLFGGTGRTRGLIAQEYGRVLAGLGIFYAMNSLNDDAKITFDPRSSDFGKIRFGNTRVDPLAGLAQAAVFVTRLVSGETKNSQGKLLPLRDSNRYSATGKVPYGGNTVSDVIDHFVRSKLAPVPGAGVDIVAGKNVVGEPTTAASTVGHLAVPMSVKDVYKSLEDQGVPRGAAISLLAILGMGAQTYEKKRPGVNKQESTVEQLLR